MNRSRNKPTNRILVAERDEARAEALVGLLGGSGYDPVHVTTMKEVVKQLKLETFALVVTNTAVEKEKDGIKLAQMIMLRRMVSGPPPPIMIVSPLRDAAVIRESMRVGVIDYVVYPYDPQNLVDRVRKVLGDRDAMTDSDLDAAVSEALGKIIDLPTISPVCARLERLLADRDVTAEQVASAVQLDPSIAAKVLKLANSASFGLQRRIASIREAVPLLGLKRVAAIVQTASTFDAIGRVQESPHFDRRAFWQHSIGTGAIAGVLARRAGLDPDQALVAGVLHDVGKVILDGFFPDLFREALEKAAADGLPLRQAEAEVLPVTHEAVGRHLARLWGLPGRLVDVIGAHDSLKARDEHLRLVQVVHVANALCRQLRVGRAGDDTATPPEPAALSALGLDAELLARLQPDFQAAVQRAEALLELV